MRLQEEWVEELRQIVRRHLPDPTYRAFIFGSRAEGGNRRFSDVDVGILGPAPVPTQTLGAIKEDLDESDLPYLVDVVDFATVSEKFKKIAMSATIPL